MGFVVWGASGSETSKIRRWDVRRFAALIALGSCVVLLLAGCGTTPSPQVAIPTLTPSPPSPTPTSAPPEPIGAQEMAQILAGTDVPALDLPDRQARIGTGRPLPRTLSGPVPDYAVGDVVRFSYADPSSGMIRPVPAELCYLTDHAYVWVETGVEVDQVALAQAAERFENQIYPTVRDLFGEEWSPGVDNDPRISLLHLTGLAESSIGEFGSGDEYTDAVVPGSNQREMFYVGLDGVVIGDDEHMGILAHEFQHMVQWNTPGNEAHWLDEGLAQLAERAVGYATVQTGYDFLRQSRTQLNSWVQGRDDENRHYGAAYLYLLYLWERLGDDFLRTLARHPAEGLPSVNVALAVEGAELTADDLFADWIVANYLDDPALADGRYSYRSEELGPVCPRQRYTALPVRETRSIPQYAAEYIEIKGQGQFAVDFRGATEAALIPAAAHGGHSFWWSNRGDEAEMSLTRAFDLSGLEEATLEFWAWHDIEQPAEEFACVGVSTDSGVTWSYPSPEGAPRSPYYPCYTGISGGGSEPEWVKQEMDLSSYAGEEILLRFEYVTDGWYNRPGFAVDDVAIPELDYVHDAEDGEDGWEGAGFVRTSNVVAQNWALWLVTPGDEVTVQRLDVAADGTAHAEVALTGGAETATLIVGAMAPGTAEEARYELEIAGALTSGSPPTPTEAGVLFRDAFDDVCSGWGSYSDGQVSSGYADGGLYLELADPAGSRLVVPGRDFTDVVIEVDSEGAGPAMDNSWGVLCRFQDHDNHYRFEIGNDGLYAITAMVNGGAVPLAGWAESGAINRGPGAVNHLTVTCDGDLLRLGVNGRVLAEATDTTFATGDVGLIASSYSQGGARTLFDNLVVRQP